MLDFLKTIDWEWVGRIAAVASAAFSAYAAFNSRRLVQVLVRSEQLSLRPIASVDFSDYEDRLAVCISNKGVGPLVIDRITVTDATNKKLGDNLVYADGLPWQEKFVVDFTAELPGRAMRPGDTLTLLSVSGPESDAEFHAYLKELRKFLGQCSFAVHYNDIFGTPQTTALRSGSWFSRHNS